MTNSTEGKGIDSPPVPAKVIACHIIELDKCDGMMKTWSYPSSERTQMEICFRKIAKIRDSSSASGAVAKYFKYCKTWHYINISPPLPSPDMKCAESKFSKIDRIAIIIEAEDFNPARYEDFGNLFIRVFVAEANPTVLLRQFLSLVVTGKCHWENTSLKASKYDAILPFQNFRVRSLITKFGIETIVLLTAVLRKQRVVVYNRKVDALIKDVLSILALGSRGCDTWDNVFPWVGDNDDELAQFADMKFYIVGCLNASIENRPSFYDVFVNIPAAEISVASHAKERMMMSKPHKEVALYMVQLAQTRRLMNMI
ncbi:Protein FAM45A [Orchesella cincta]|uniref:Protein FAM45A n=1 Tax=Orchesella cincta TaxID=48709 RepID=A0A1D2ND27_ORCCI|nr:Protein FAM45A [Orchesella cincta]